MADERDILTYEQRYDDNSTISPWIVRRRMPARTRVGEWEMKVKLDYDDGLLLGLPMVTRLVSPDVAIGVVSVRHGRVFHTFDPTNERTSTESDWVPLSAGDEKYEIEIYLQNEEEGHYNHLTEDKYDKITIVYDKDHTSTYILSKANDNNKITIQLRRC